MAKKRRTRDLLSGILNIVVLLMVLPLLTSAISTEDPTTQALLAILPTIIIINALMDFF